MSEPTPSTHSRRIVAAVDFSAESERALAWATHLAVRSGAELLLVHAVIWPAASDPFYGEAALMRELVAAAQRRLEGLAAGLQGEVRAVSCVVMQGAPVSVVLEVAKIHEADLVVLGTRGLTGWKHALLGSTAQRVIAKSECPVLAVHGSDPLPEEGGWLVLAATDGSAEALSSVRTGLRLLGRGASQVVLVRAFEHQPGLYPASAERLSQGWMAESRRMAEENLGKAARSLAGDGVDVATRLCDGFGADVILRESQRTDLVVMGTRGAGLGHLFLGSTAERVAQRASVPVLVVPHACTSADAVAPVFPDSRATAP
jgi:nucleotide-binding universal stress UspA family protein